MQLGISKTTTKRSSQVHYLQRHVLHLNMAIVTVLEKGSIQTDFVHSVTAPRTVYIGASGWGWNASFALQWRIICKPPGSVSRKIPNLIPIELAYTSFRLLNSKYARWS